MRLLVLDGFEVACAQTGGDGLARATEGAWQVIVLDLHLPDLLGMTVLSELRRHAITTPVIVVTGWYLDDAGHERAAAALGATFLRKPLDSDQLASALRAAAAGGAPPPAFSPETQPAASSTVRRAFLSPPDDDIVAALHDRVIAGDETALALLIERVEPRLDGALVAGFSRIPHEWAHDAVQDALLEYAARPDRFNPSFGIALSGFLLIAARRNLLNRLDAAKRRGRHETAVPHTDSSALTPASIPRPERRLDAARLLRRVLEFFDGPERAVLRAILQGETRWEGLARAAHLEDRPPAEQRAIVTRIRKRIAQRLRRFGGRS